MHSKLESKKETVPTSSLTTNEQELPQAEPRRIAIPQPGTVNYDSFGRVKKGTWDTIKETVGEWL